MLVDEDDEDEEEVSGHTQEADGGQQDRADRVLLGTRKKLGKMVNKLDSHLCQAQ